MKNLFAIILLIVAGVASAGTCTTTSRNNYSTNQILTSSALNADFNQLVTKANAFDGGCVTTGTLESDALETSQFAPVLNGITEGCTVSYSSASELSVGACIASVNGNFVRKTTATTVAFGCSGCSAEANSTTYYAYINKTSTGSTLNLLISTTAPGVDGYDASGNKVLARFYNNSSGNISQYQIDQWNGKQFENRNNVNRTRLASASDVEIFHAYINCDASSSITSQAGVTVDGANWASSITNISGGTCSLTYPSTAFGTIFGCQVTSMGSDSFILISPPISSTAVAIDCVTSAGADCTSFDAFVTCFGTRP
jgi:hypothetical protein